MSIKSLLYSSRSTLQEGVTWIEKTGLSTSGWGTSATVTDIAANPNLTVAVSASRKIAFSTNNTTWTNFASVSQDQINVIAAEPPYFYKFSLDAVESDMVAQRTSNGSTWTTVNLGTNWSQYRNGTLGCKTLYDQGLLLWGSIEGYGGFTHSTLTTLAETFFDSIIPTDRSFDGITAIAATSTNYILAARDTLGSNILVSNKSTPTVQTLLVGSVSTSQLRGLTYNAAASNGSYAVFVGPATRLVVTNGSTYSFVDISTTGWGTSVINDILWTGSTFIIVGAGGKVATSPDGLAWNYAGTVWTGGASATCIAMNPSTGQLIVGGQYGKIATSPF